MCKSCIGKSVNKTRIGAVVAIEIEAVLRKYGEPTKTVQKSGFTVRIFSDNAVDIIVVESGAGEVSAAAAAQLLIDCYEPELILNFGAVGALHEGMAAAELCVVKSVIHYDFITDGWLNLPRGQYPGTESPFLDTDAGLVERVTRINSAIMPVVCASADKFVDAAEDKKALRERYGADICEMEAAGIVLTCRRANMPCLLIKAVSDTLVGGGAEFMRELDRVSDICMDTVDELVRSLHS